MRLAKLIATPFLVCCLSAAHSAHAQVPVAAAADQATLLASSDAQLAANKRLVYDFWREVFEGGHLELADKYLADSYIQHNPNVPTGRAAFVSFFAHFKKPLAIQPTISMPLVSITAEGDRVILAFAHEGKDAAGNAYTTTWFDMFRVANGKITEHWDPATRQ